MIVKKTGYVAIGLGIAIVIFVGVLGTTDFTENDIDQSLDADTVPEETALEGEPSVDLSDVSTTSEETASEGRKLVIGLSDGVASTEP